ncbi:MAG: hypothetical protein ACUBOA_02680 [Candidatus Loosdrechtia sp.]|uniref:hypothetical protein n=1 Tax=Candidatus Loosdrechtia sp. TaxID=3101272 RepID=UPI003A64C904|nr:MAG: hypothetical protein QY305_02075 [Candidatus Jettenia sp. AMX2]
MKTSIIEEFIKRIVGDKNEHLERFYEIFSARGFLLELDKSSGKVRLSNDSHREDGEFLEILQHVNYKKIYHKPHQDAIDKQDNESIVQNCHVYFNFINTQLFDINNDQYLAEIFTQEIPVDLFRLNWERDWYGKFNQFRECERLPRIRVYDLEPFIARLVKAISSIGISTWSSCEGHWGEPAYIVFDGKYHRIWFQAIVNKFIRKKLNLVCRWDWLGWDDRCSIKSPGRDQLALYLEIQGVARLIYDNRTALKNSKRQVCSQLTDKHKSMNQKEMLNIFENYFEESITRYLQNERITLQAS